MKALNILPVIVLSILPSYAQDLKQADREALLEKLEQIQERADSSVDAKFRTAVSAFKAAMSSESAAIDLYLKCEEKVNFEEMKKKSSDFRNWRRNNTDKLSDAAFKSTLRQQLRWLVLTIEAAEKNPDLDKLAIEAGKIVDSIMSQAEDLSSHRSVLEQSVTSTVFAQAYNINGLKLEDWPLSPMQISEIYEQVLLPPLRQPDRLSSLRATWQNRMVHESALVDQWSLRPGEKLRPGEHTPQYERFVTNKLPQLKWAAEIDLFKAGDERTTALRMLKHIEDNLSHEAAPGWAREFTQLLQGDSSAEVDSDSDSDSPGEPAP